MGDHAGILGAVVFVPSFFEPIPYLPSYCTLCLTSLDSLSPLPSVSASKTHFELGLYTSTVALVPTLAHSLAHASFNESTFTNIGSNGKDHRPLVSLPTCFYMVTAPQLAPVQV